MQVYFIVKLPSITNLTVTDKVFIVARYDFLTLEDCIKTTTQPSQYHISQESGKYLTVQYDWVPGLATPLVDGD